MYRHLLRLETLPRLSQGNVLRAAACKFSTKDPKKENDESKTTVKEKETKSQKISKLDIVKLNADSNVDQKKNDSLQSKIPKDNKIDVLMKNAKNFESVAPNDNKTVSQSIAKPKTYVRQSARNKSESSNMASKDTEPVQVLARGLDQRLVDAARRVASKMPKHIAKATEKELLESINKQKNDTLKARKQMENNRQTKEDFTKSISYQIMKESRRAQMYAETAEEINNRIEPTVVKIKLPSTSHGQSLNQRRIPLVNKFKKDTSLFSGECLNIFDPNASFANDTLNRNPLWERLLQEEIELSVDYPPENAFEEMIKWTKEGKLWKFPINNEQGLEAEEETPFYEHVLLDNLLEGFPHEGPVRQFMELVIMGLSQNPYISVERKHETIGFYKNFFEERDFFNLNLTTNEASLSQ